MGIHATAIVDPSARIGDDVEIGPFTIVHGNVEIGDRTVIENHCEIGRPTPLADGSPLRIGPRSLIRSHSILYEGSSFGEELTTGHRVTVREGTKAGIGLQVGTGSDIQGDCSFGNYIKTQSDVMVGKHTTIGDFVWLFPRVSILNDPMPPFNILDGAKIEDWAVICAHSLVMPGVTVGEGAFVGVETVVNRDIAAGRIVCGNPMRDKGDVSRLRLPRSRQPARPWMQHFTRGYPEEVVAAWRQGVPDLKT